MSFRYILILGCVALAWACKNDVNSAGESSQVFILDKGLIDTFATSDLDDVLPRLTGIYPDVSMEQAYRLQEHWAKAKFYPDAGIGGIKGGVVSPEAMATFGTTEPLCGILPMAGRLDYYEGMTYKVDCPATKIETEIGFIVSKAITSHIEDLSQFREHLEGVCPIIEIPCGQWDAPDGTPNPADVVATNMSAHDYMVGPLSPLDELQIGYELIKDGQSLHTASSSANWTGPLETAMFLANFSVDQNIILEPGMVIICGALGAVHDATPGDYVLKAEGVASLSFSITD